MVNSKNKNKLSPRDKSLLINNAFPQIVFGNNNANLIEKFDNFLCQDTQTNKYYFDIQEMTEDNDLKKLFPDDIGGINLLEINEEFLIRTKNYISDKSTTKTEDVKNELTGGYVQLFLEKTVDKKYIEKINEYTGNEFAINKTYNFPKKINDKYQSIIFNMPKKFCKGISCAYDYNEEKNEQDFIWDFSNVTPNRKIISDENKKRIKIDNPYIAYRFYAQGEYSKMSIGCDSQKNKELVKLTSAKQGWQYDDNIFEKNFNPNFLCDLGVQKILSDVKKEVSSDLFFWGDKKNNDVTVFKQTRFFEQMNYFLQKTILKEQIEFTKVDETFLKPLVFIVKTKTQNIIDRREYEDTIGRATVLSQSEMASIKKFFSDMRDILLKAEILCPSKDIFYSELRTSDKISFIDTYIDEPIIKNKIYAKKLGKVKDLIKKYSQGARMTFSNDINKEIKHASEKSIDEYIDNLHFHNLQKIFSIVFLFDSQFYKELENTLRWFVANEKNNSEDDFDMFFDNLDKIHSWEKPFAIYKESEGVYTFIDNEDKIQDKKFFQELMYQAFYSFTKKKTKTKKGINFTKIYKSKNDASEWLSDSPESLKTITDKLFEQFNTTSDIPYCTCICNEMNMYSNILEKVEQEKEKSKDIKTDFINIFKIQMQNKGWRIYSKEMKFDEKLMEAEIIDDNCFSKEKSKQDKIKQLFETKVRIMCGDTSNTGNGENE